MLSLDLFDSRYERQLREGAVDDLEARRIDDLNDRMQDLLARAREPEYQANPRALAALKKQFQQVKDERDSYYKVREAGIPGNVPVEKIPGKEDLLKGRGRSYYEDTVNEDDVEDFIKAGGKITYGKPQKGPRRPGMSLASRHIGGGNDRMKPSRSGRAANTQGKPVVSVEDQKKNPALGEKKLGQLRPSLGTGHDMGRSVKKFRTQRGLDEGQVSDEVDHRGDVDTKANIEVLGVDLNDDTFKITYNKKPYQVKIQNFSQESLGRWQIADYDVDIINSKGKNIIDLVDWDNDRQVKMINTIIAYLDTQQAGDIQLMAWRQAGMANSTAEDLYQEIQDFYKNDKQQIDKATAWLAQNIEDAEERQVFANFVKNPVSRPAKTKYVPKEYLMYVAFSYSREGNTELTPGMNLKPIQLDDPDDEEELHRKVDELLKKVQFKFDAFENKIVELADSYGLGSDPDLGSGFGQREMVWDHKTMTTSSSESNKNRQQILAKGILNFRADVEKYVASFNNTLIKIGLPGIGEYSTWSGVLGDQLNDQQVRYFATPEGFASLATGKIDVAKMIDDNVEKQGMKEDDGLPRNGRKLRTQHVPNEKSTGPLDQKLQRLKVQARRQFPLAHTDDEALILKLLDKETQDDQATRRTDARQDAELRKNFALDREQDDDIDNLQTQVSIKEHGGGIGPRQHWQDLMQEGQPLELMNRYLAIDADNDVDAVKQAIQTISKDPNVSEASKARLLGQLGMIIKRYRLPIGRDYYQFMQQYMEEQSVTETVVDVKSGMARIYRRLAPKIERHRDSFLAGQLYDELENYAELHGAERQFKQMMNSARNRAHMEYDTNPGGFHNWFWFLPFEDESLDEIDRRGFLKGLGATAGLAAMGGVKAATSPDDPSWRKVGQPFDNSVTTSDQVKQVAGQQPTLSSRIANVKGPNAKGEYLVTVIHDDDIVSDYVTKTPPKSWMQGTHKAYPQVEGMAEGTDDVKKRMAKLEALALAANRAGDDAKCKMYQQKIQSLKQKLSQSMSEAISKKDLLSRLEKDLPKVTDPKNKDVKPVEWTGAGKDDYGYTGYQGHGMPTDKQERESARKKKKGVAEAEGEYKVYYMTAEDHKLMGRYASCEEAEQRLNQLQSEYPDNKFIIWTNSKQGMTEIDKSQPSQERHGHRSLGAKGTTAKPVAAKKVVKDLAMDLDQAFAKEKQVKKKGVAEGHEYGSKVQHPKYGPGQVLKVYPNGMITVNFPNYPDPVDKKPGIQSNFMPGDSNYQSLKSGVAESAKPGEYYIHTVYFKDGTKKRIRVTSDEVDVADYYTKRGQAVDRVDYDFQLHSDMTEGLKSTIKEDQDTSGVEQAILKRIMVAHLDLLRQYGPEKVMQAAEEVAYNVGDVDEIGTSDVSAYVAQVKQILGATP